MATFAFLKHTSSIKKATMIFKREAVSTAMAA